MNELEVKGNEYIEEINMYSVHDKKSGYYDIPFCAKNDLFAKRKFIMDIRNRQSTMLSSFKDDFVLMKLGYFSGNDMEFNRDIKVLIQGKEVENNEISNAT